MNISLENIRCRELEGYKTSRREKPFLMVKYSFSYDKNNFDKAILNKIIKEGEKMASGVHSNAANAGEKQRSQQRIVCNAVAGVLAEYCWKSFLNSVSLHGLVRETKYEAAATQIDLETIKGQKTIEVRSSFPRNGIEFALCSEKHEFDILGPYKNAYKPGEPSKDFYVRTLYYLAGPLQFLEDCKKDDFAVHLTGGATWAMMSDDDIAVEKTLIPEDALTDVATPSTYRVVPFSKALDCNEIYQEILRAG